MKKFICILLLLIFIAGMVTVCNAGGEEGAVRVVKIEGEVEKLSTNILTKLFGIYSRVDLETGDVLESGDRIKTGSTGRVELKYNEGSYVRIDPETTVELVANRQLERSTSSAVELLQGRIWVKLKKLWQEVIEFEVITPSAVAGVRGTVFSVSVTDEEELVSVEEGEVEFSVRERDERVIVSAGKMSRLVRDEIGLPVKMDRAERARWRREDIERWLKTPAGVSQNEGKGQPAGIENPAEEKDGKPEDPGADVEENEVEPGEPDGKPESEDEGKDKAEDKSEAESGVVKEKEGDETGETGEKSNPGAGGENESGTGRDPADREPPVPGDN